MLQIDPLFLDLDTWKGLFVLALIIAFSVYSFIRKSFGLAGVVLWYVGILLMYNGINWLIGVLVIILGIFLVFGGVKK